jgi:hypothetical protein
MFGCTPNECKKNGSSLFWTQEFLMKALVSAFALVAFVASSALLTQSHAQTAATGQTMAPETATSAAPTTTTAPKKRHHSSKSSHAKKKSKKSTTAQTSSAKQKHARRSVS